MIFVQKQHTPPSEFLDAVAGLNSYDELQGQAREVVIKVLLAEQGGLCAICERNGLRKISFTIEHFIPRSQRPDLQLDYHNLYIACKQCNEPKAEFLLPPFIFDPRFDPCRATHPIAQHKGVYQKFNYSAGDGNCTVSVPSASFADFSDVSKPKIRSPRPEHYAGYMLHCALELMAQNRTFPDYSNLLEARGVVYALLMKNLPMLPDSKIIHEWNAIVNARANPSYRFPEFVSLQLQLLSRERTKRGI